MARKSPAEKIEKIRRVVGAWEGLAPDAVFYGMTLEQFKAAIRPSEETREVLNDLGVRVRLTTSRRNFADDKSMQLIDGVACGVRGDPKHGEDSLLYARMGYVRKSARRRRRSKQPAHRHSRRALD